jgi:hypothetical protein
MHIHAFLYRLYAPDSITILTATIYISYLSGIYASVNTPREHFPSYPVTDAHDGTDAFTPT